MPFGDGIDVAAPGRTESPARGFVFDVGAATRLDVRAGRRRARCRAGRLPAARRAVPGAARRDHPLALDARARRAMRRRSRSRSSGQEIGRATPGVSLDAAAPRRERAPRAQRAPARALGRRDGTAARADRHRAARARPARGEDTARPAASAHAARRDPRTRGARRRDGAGRDRAAPGPSGRRRSSRLDAGGKGARNPAGPAHAHRDPGALRRQRGLRARHLGGAHGHARSPRAHDRASRSRCVLRRLRAARPSRAARAAA